MDGWNTSFLLGWLIFRCYVSFREGIYYLNFGSFWDGIDSWQGAFAVSFREGPGDFSGIDTTPPIFTVPNIACEK